MLGDCFVFTTTFTCSFFGSYTGVHVVDTICQQNILVVLLPIVIHDT